MKIDNSLRSGLTGGVQDTQPGKSDASTTRKGGSAGSDDVRLSPLAAQLQAIDNHMGGDTIDAARIAEIKQAIAEGRFQINPEAIADRLLETVRELLRSQKS